MVIHGIYSWPSLTRFLRSSLLNVRTADVWHQMLGTD
jgi:ABC-type dipeptide/oligopeptide/nickel transport system permease subunit